MVKLLSRLHLPFEPWPVANLIKFTASEYDDYDEEDDASMMMMIRIIMMMIMMNS